MKCIHVFVDLLDHVSYNKYNNVLSTILAPILFSSPKLKAQASFYDYFLSSIRLSVCKLYICDFSRTTGQKLQPYLAQIIIW